MGAAPAGPALTAALACASSLAQRSSSSAAGTVIGTRANAAGAAAAATTAAAARSSSGPGSIPTSGLAKGPRTYSGVRSDRNFHSSDSGLMRRSMCSCFMSMVPTASTMASSVLSLALRVCATPSLTEKSATAQRNCTSLSSPNSLATTMLPTFSAARSSSCLLSVPSRTYSRLSPELLPSMAATESP